MHILVYEYLTGRDQNGNEDHTLFLEGEHMVMGLVRDLLNIGGISVTLIRNAKLPDFPLQDDRLRVFLVRSNENPDAEWIQALHNIDAVWPIAPETEGCLSSICEQVEAHGKRLLTTSKAGVDLASSKGVTLRTLEQFGVPMVPTRALGASENACTWNYPWVFKIDDGVGCENTFIIRGPHDQRAFLETPRKGDWLMQPLLEGEPLSLSGLFHRGEARLLCCNRQKIRQGLEGFSLQGITVNALPDPEKIFAALLSRIAEAMPLLWGLVGIDLLLTHEGPKVLEINPRLTSAYPGIMPATGLNPAALVIELAGSGILPQLSDTPSGIPIDLDWSGNPCK